MQRCGKSALLGFIGSRRARDLSGTTAAAAAAVLCVRSITERKQHNISPRRHGTTPTDRWVPTNERASDEIERIAGDVLRVTTPRAVCGINDLCRRRPAGAAQRSRLLPTSRSVNPQRITYTLRHTRLFPPLYQFSLTSYVVNFHILASNTSGQVTSSNDAYISQLNFSQVLNFNRRIRYFASPL